jgi:outer membrane receptor protein involved in Fe transport
VGQTDELAGRFLADWKPSEKLHVSLNLNFWNDLDDTQAPQVIAITPQNLPGATGLGGTIPASLPIYHYPLAPHDDQAADWSPGNRPRQDNRFKQAAVRVDYNITDDLTLTSLTSYDYLKYSNSTEGDGTALDDLDLLGDNAQINSINQELRLANNPKDRLRYVIGANYEHTRVDENTGLTYLQSTSEAVNGIAVSSYYSNQVMSNAAVFGNLEYDVIDKVTLKAGVRETEARHSDIGATLDEAEYPVPPGHLTLTQFFNDVYGAIYKGAVPRIAPGAPIELNDIVGSPGYLTAEQFRGQINEDSTSWSVGADYKPSPTVLFYVNVSRGYKAGAFPQVSGSVFIAYEPVKEESLLDFEGGTKLRLLQGRLSINGAGFHYDYSDKQLRAKFIDPLFGSLDRLVNVPRSTVDGGEVEINARPIDGLTLSSSVTYLNALVSQYQGATGSYASPLGLREPILQSFAGVQLPFAPKWQYVARADYNFPISDRLSGFFGVGMNGQTSPVGILTPIASVRTLYNINDRTVFNLNAGVQTADGRWKFSLFGDNIFNKYYWTNTIQSYDTVVRYTGRPADWGGKLSYEF